MRSTNHQAALHDLEKVLALLRSVKAPEGATEDGVEHLLELAVASYEQKMVLPINTGKKPTGAPQLTPLPSSTR